ncbi:unnamed protein product [Phytophthora fragariaefolia]|uniref:Unnamed protein product n=1 Tax=Phytophthora fragariaefolia TaxID=1490495 RepID=A0A9W6Y4R1_9STRA|nr:unnamed protein product [Phytophthora fragariaefolia]
MREAEVLEETLAFLDDALNGGDDTVSNGDLDATNTEHFEFWGPSRDQDLDLFVQNSSSNESHRDPEQQMRRRRTKKNYNHNKAREEFHAELVRLRAEVENLEFTLERLRTIRGEECLRSSEHTEKELQNKGESVWRHTCARQLEQRLRAEREHIHLVQSVERERQFIKKMQRHLNVQPALRNMVCPGTSKVTKRIEIPRGYIKDIADLIFSELSAGVEATYRQVEHMDSAIEPLLLHSTTCEPIVRGGCKEKRVEVFDRTIMPFGLSQTGDAWWKHWHNFRGQRAEDNPENVVTESFGFEITDVETNTFATFYVQQILWRHIGKNRIVFVWNSYSEPLVFKKKRISGVYYSEQSYVLIKSSDEAADGMSTYISSYLSITPHYLDPRLAKDTITMALTKFLMSSMPSEIMTQNEIVESLLLDQTLRRRRDG